MLNYKDRSVLYRCRKGLTVSFLVLLLSSVISLGQDTKEEAPPLKDRLFFGGSFALTIGTITNIELSPVVGLWVFPRIAAALGPTFWFYKYREEQRNIYGGRGYAEWVFLRGMDKFLPLGANTNLFLHFEDEVLSLNAFEWNKAPASYNPKRFLVNTVLAGGGISQLLGRRASMNLMILWVLNDSGYSLYSNPVIRLGFVF